VERIRLPCADRRTYSLIVRLALLACSLRMTFSSSVMRISIRELVPFVRVEFVIVISDSVGSRGEALSKMRNHFSE